MEGKYLITTNDWFVAPDGKQYKAVWGYVTILTDELLGVKTNRNSANWFAKVGGDDNHIIIAGCQIYYACRCEEHPNNQNVKDYKFKNGKKYKRPTYIYIAE